ncbi:ligand-binding sensor domain-containing protein [Emticicia fontis]
MTKSGHIYALLMIVSCTWCAGQSLPKSYYPTDPETKEVVTSHGPRSITRNIRQDKKGNIWIAAFDGIFRYDPSAMLKVGGKAFTNITSEVSTARFFDVLEDRKGNFWFASIGSGVFYFDPSKAGQDAFQHFTTKEGLANDRVPHIYEDKSGNIWFGTESGATRYDGKSFQTYKPNGGLPDTNPNDNDINSIIEDKTGKFWFGTRGRVFNFDGEKFTIVKHNGESFTNIRTIIKDKKGNIWLAGEVGLWRYDGNTFTNFNKNFTGYVYEDKEGNIWTSSQPDYNGTDRWALSRYDANTLSSQKPAVIDIMAHYEDYKNMLFGILEAKDGSIWFGALDGVRRFDGKAITHFTSK